MKSILSFEEKFIDSFFSLSLFSGIGSTTMFPEHLNHFHKTQVFKIIDIGFKRLIYLISSVRKSKFQLVQIHLPLLSLIYSDMLFSDIFSCL